MVNILAERPDVFFPPNDGDVYYAMSTEKGIYAYGCLNFAYPPVAMVHLEIKEFSHNILKSIIKDDWPYCLEQCKKHGCHILSITKEGTFESNKTWMKFVRHFGFKQFSQYTSSVQTIGD